MSTNLTGLYEQVAKAGQIPSPLDQQGRIEKLSQLRNATQTGQQELQMNQMKIQEAQHQQAEQSAAQRAYQDANGDIDTYFKLLPKYGVSQDTVTKQQKGITEYKKSLLDLSDAEHKQRMAKNAAIASSLDGILSLPDDETRQAAWPIAVKSLTDQQYLSPEEAQQFAQYPGEQQVKMLDMQRKTSEQIDKQVDNERQAAIAKATQAHNKIMEVPESRREFLAQYDTWREANDKPKNAKSELEFQDIYDKKQAALKRAGTAAGAAQDFTPDTTPTDPESQSILSQAGLSMPAFLVLTGSSSQLPRDAATRTKAFREAQDWSKKRGIDTSTMASQYKTYNETLGQNIARLNNTKIMESELQGTADNLRGVANEKDLGKLNVENVVKIWAGQQVNDDLAQQYAIHLAQLRNELAAYFAATQGRSGGSINITDQRDAENVIKNGISSGSLRGLQTAVDNSTKKMGNVMQQSVDRSRKAIWDLFGVGAKYKNTATGTAPTNRKSLDEIFSGAKP